MGNGKWEMGNGQWGMGNGEWGMGNGEWGMGNGEWAMGNGEWAMGKGESEEQGEGRGASKILEHSKPCAFTRTSFLGPRTFHAARRSLVSLISDSAGMPSSRCKRRIICSVNGRLPLSTSYTRLI